MKFLNVAFPVIFLLLMIFTATMYGSIFFELKKSTGNFLSYYIIISLLLGIVLTILGLTKVIYKKAKMGTMRHRILSKYLDVSEQVILLIMFAFSIVLFGSIFSNAIKSLGIFLAYFIFIMLLLSVLITIRELVKAVKKKA
ncbi:MAG: hypothetical protein ACTHMM_07245 [Agriterribacter sp.]